MSMVMIVLGLLWKAAKVGYDINMAIICGNQPPTCCSQTRKFLFGC